MVQLCLDKRYCIAPGCNRIRYACPSSGTTNAEGDTAIHVGSMGGVF
ncbi:hypothetical protein [Eubacterium barkeri]|nr:hypothetical protein [Eubacterium barkeri]